MLRVLLVSLILAGGVLGWLYWRQGRPEPLVVSGFIEADEIRVGSRVGGRVAAVHASEGERVAAGGLLFELDPFDLREQLSEARAVLSARRAEHARLLAGFREEEVEQAQAQRDRAAATLDRLIAGPRPREIEITRQELAAAAANLEFAEAEHQRLLDLQAGRQTAQTEVDQAVRALKAARAEHEAARQRLGLLEEGTRVEDIAAARAALAEAQQALNLLERGYRPEDIERAAAEVAAAEALVAAMEVRIAELTITSPCDCVLETIELEPGDLVAANAPAVALLDLSHLWVRSYVPENWLGEVRLGQKVAVTVDSFPGERFQGEVTFISRSAEFTPRNIQTPEERSKQVFRIKVTLRSGLDRLRVGMIADVLLDEEPPA